MFAKRGTRGGSGRRVTKITAQIPTLHAQAKRKISHSTNKTSKEDFISLVSLEGVRRRALDMARARLAIVLLLFGVGYVVLGVRVCDVALFDERAIQNSMTPQYAGVRMGRGDIYDRNGVLIATNLNTASLYANPKDIMDVKEAVKGLREIFPEFSVGFLEKKLQEPKSFVWIKRSITPKEQLAVNNLGLPGLYFHKEEGRVYPQGRLFSHLLGYVGDDGDGLSGLERAYNKYLISDAARDKPLRVSLDVRVQSSVWNSLNWAMKEFRAEAATGIVMDVKTGEVLAMVSLPDFDPHHPGASEANAKFNRATLGLYEMGSTFKSFTTAMALDSGIVKIDDYYDARDPIKFGRFSIKDFHAKNRVMSVPEIFMYSSNIGTAKMAQDVGVVKQRQFLKTMGLLDHLDIEIAEHARPMFPKVWQKIHMMTISYGHGIAVTPMHVAMGASALVNGGILMPPTLIKAGKEVQKTGVRVINEQTSLMMRKLFRLVVEHGTGGKAAVPGYVVGGKTGSADKVSAKGGYKTNSRLASFVSAFPMHEPRYVVLVVIDDPQGNASTGGYATGGMTAAPVTGRIINAIAPMLDVMPVDEADPVIETQLHIPFQTEKKLASN